MALTGTLASLGVVACLLAVAVAFGVRCLRWLKLVPIGLLEEALYAAAFSFLLLEGIVFFLGWMGWLHRATLLVLFAAMALSAGSGWRRVGELSTRAGAFVSELSATPRYALLGTLIVCFLLLDALMAMAPLTGSDALHYHFSALMVDLGKRFEPNFSLVHSFFIGQTHMLILTGLTLGSARIAQGLIYLGGVLAAGSLFLLSRELVSLGWALAVVLSFVLTPLAYWQMTTAGAPDIWMAFYATMAIFAASRGVTKGDHRWLVLAGLFAGAVGGAKYTGWAIVAALTVAVVAETKALHLGALTLCAALAAGVYPLLRNFWWTRDPFFPFLTRWLDPASVNSYTLTLLMADTKVASVGGGFWEIIGYPFLMVLRGGEHGLGHYLGPLVLAFAPLLVLVPRGTPLVRIAALVWFGVFLSNLLGSQMGRFLLPVLPAALALVFAGMARASAREWPIVRAGCWGTLLLFYLFGAGSYAAYAKDFLPVSLGFEKRAAFLERMAPDYQIVSFVNRALAGQSGKVMVFFRHVYYLRLPYAAADPGGSWQMDPDRYRDPEQLLGLLRQLGVRWVVKSPRYPDAFETSFEQLEREGRLQPIASASVQDFAGFRLNRQREEVHAVILEVAGAKP